ncbi:capsule assembly Wzi family protein [Spirosoma sp. RP8]|uniref:Capsule assembly Wzi family protein n=1 Tax=Spirosoma liriopis TaxID=2937440 RepID=A0ABT0HTD9_9BACT|nr:capsule assembly Wzi family protein [Spirosoma liriopis]MCK8495468.1 capsule assembly Wzi family protein [Spirosoma liriopis]
MLRFQFSVTTFCLTAGLACSTGELLKAQPVAGNETPVNGFIETGGFVVNGAMPFWFRANQSGIVPLSGSTGQLRMGLYRDNYRVDRRDSLIRPKNIDWGYGFEVVGNTGQQNQLILPEGYLGVRWKQFEIYAGRRRGMVGLVDTLLTSGSYAWSGNALPIPKIQIGTIGYVPIGLTKGFVAINAFFNHGWFSSGFVRNSYLHQKAIYVRLGKPTAKVNLYFGGNQEVQWGGFAPSLVGVPGLSDNMDGRFASDLDAFYRVITATSGTGYVPPQGVISIDQGNRIGNHLGSFDGGIELKMKGYKVFAYRQNLYETGALFYLTNITDGLHGIRIQRSQPNRRPFSVDRFLLEFFNSKSQGGPEFVIDDPQRRGRNNYFNHSQYQDGWTYQGRTIGTPFLTARGEANPSLPQNYPITNNRVSLWHMGLAGKIGQQVNWLTKLSYSQNYGTYDFPYPAGTNQLSVLLMLNASVQLPVLKSCQLNSSFGLDTGNLLPNSYGCYFGVRKALFDDVNYRTRKK